MNTLQASSSWWFWPGLLYIPKSICRFAVNWSFTAERAR